ncbi:MAG: glutathione S-transferase family protein [Polyangiales bacterium]
MPITLYAAPFSSAIPVTCALAELSIPHERITVDFTSGVLKTKEFLALNPNGKVPTLVVDGTPMFEAVAIVQWLGDRYGVAKGLWPAADSPARMTALAWTTWAYVTFGAELLRLNYAQSERFAPELRSAASAEHAKGELQKLLGLLDARLAKQAHMLGPDYSLCDLVVANTVKYATLCGVTTEGHPNLSKWLDRCIARPAIRSEWGA